jgi:hypothetical protein
MATSGRRSKQRPRTTRSQRVPLWLALSAVAAIAFVIYGAMVKSPPSAFDRPEAQNPDRARSPWVAVRPM